MFVFGFPSDALKYIQAFRLWDRGELTQIFPNQALFINFTGFFTRNFGEKFGFDLALIAAFALSFVTIYHVALQLVSRGPSVLAAIIYCSSQYYFWHGSQNLELILGAGFLPLFILSAVNLEKSIQGPGHLFRNSIVVGILLSLILLSSFYLGYLSVIILCSFFLFYRLVGPFLKISVSINRQVLAGYITVIVTFVFLSFPAYFQLLEYRFGQLPPKTFRTISAAVMRNTALDVVAYSARPWDYLTPSIYHPLFGESARAFYTYLRDNNSYQFWSPDLPERANYLTFTAIILSLYAVWKLLKRRRTTSMENKRFFYSIVFLAVASFLLSMPAVLTVRGFLLPLPSYFLFMVFPMFRVYARAGIFVLLSFSLLSAYGLSCLLEGVSRKSRSSIIIAGVCLLVLFENLSYPPFPLMDVGKVPLVYDWLSKQEGNFIIAEYPTDNSAVDLGGGCPSWLDQKITRDYNGAYAAFYQTTHGKKVFEPDNSSKDERISLGDLALADSYLVLKKYGVNYVLVHTRDPMIGIHPWPYPQENPLDTCWQRRIMKKPEKLYEGFKKVAEFDDGVVYKVQ